MKITYKAIDPQTGKVKTRTTERYYSHAIWVTSRSGRVCHGFASSLVLAEKAAGACRKWCTDIQIVEVTVAPKTGRRRGSKTYRPEDIDLQSYSS